MTGTRYEENKTWTNWLLDWIRTYFGGQQSLNLDSRDIKDFKSFTDALFHATNSSWKMRTIRVRRTVVHTIPDSIGHFSNLVTLDVSHNCIDELPWSIVYLRNLEEFDLSYNDLMSLPHTIGYLATLKVLNLDHNKLRVLPKCILKLGKLKKVNVLGNPLVSPPLNVCNKGVKAIFKYLENTNYRKNLWEKSLTGACDTGNTAPTLYELCINCVLEKDVAFLLSEKTAPRIKTELLGYKKVQESLINVMKCSDCYRFFSNKHFFDTHNCD